MAKNDRVILIKGDNSKWYEQAIFIIKKDASASKMPVDFVLEAENIINNYMMRTGKAKDVVSKYAANDKPQKNVETGHLGSLAVKANRRTTDFIPYLAMLICCIILAYVVFAM